MTTTTRFDELLPFYVNGTLAEADRAWVDDWLSEHPHARAELHWARSLQTRLHEDVPAVSSEVGMERALRRMHAEGPQPRRARRAAEPTLFERFSAWMSSIVPQPVLRPAFAGAVAVVALQAVAIVHLVGEREDDASQIRALQGNVVADKGPYLKLNFKPDAREADIRLLLVEVNGSLAAGPGQLGDYYVRVPANQLAAITEKVKASGIVDGVAVVDALPGRN
jgi:anti-sigma factor RsiW